MSNGDLPIDDNSRFVSNVRSGDESVTQDLDKKSRAERDAINDNLCNIQQGRVRPYFRGCVIRWKPGD